jgi:hypothetical protein
MKKATFSIEFKQNEKIKKILSCHELIFQLFILTRAHRDVDGKYKIKLFEVGGCVKEMKIGI